MTHTVEPVPHVGRPPGRPLTDLEVRHLRLLLNIREVARDRLRTIDEQLEDFVLELLESGTSTRVMEDELGVPHRTIQTWKKNAEQRRGS